MALPHVNAVIVGAGAGGGIVAKELAVAGLSVVLLERGNWPRYDEYNDDELVSQRTPALGNPFGPDDARYRRVVVNPDGSTRVVLPSEGGYNNNAGCVGGGTVSYGAMAWRFMPQDFRLESTYGEVEGSTLDDWPIRYDDLEPFYEKAEYEIGVGRRSYAKPLRRAAEEALSHARLPLQQGRAGHGRQAAKRLGLHPFPIPMLRNSVPYNGRPACIHMRSCVGFACPVNAKAGSHNTVIPIALATRQLPGADRLCGRRDIVDDRGRARAVRYFDGQNQPQEQPADHGRRFGLGHGNRPVAAELQIEAFSQRRRQQQRLGGPQSAGPRLCRAPGPGAGRDLRGGRPRGLTVAVSDFNHGNAGLVGGGMLANEFIRLPYLFASVRPPGEPRWGKAHKDFQRRNYKRACASWARCRKCPISPPASAWIRPSRTTGGFPSAASPGRGMPTTCDWASSSSKKAEAIVKETGASGSGGAARAWASAAASTRRAPAAWATTRKPR